MMACRKCKSVIDYDCLCAPSGDAKDAVEITAAAWAAWKAGVEPAALTALAAPPSPSKADVGALVEDARRYRYLRDRDAGPPEHTPPGLFIGRVPENLILTGEDADAAIDAFRASHDGGL